MSRPQPTIREKIIKQVKAKADLNEEATETAGPLFLAAQEGSHQCTAHNFLTSIIIFCSFVFGGFIYLPS